MDTGSNVWHLWFMALKHPLKNLWKRTNVKIGEFDVSCGHSQTPHFSALKHESFGPGLQIQETNIRRIKYRNFPDYNRRFTTYVYILSKNYSLWDCMNTGQNHMPIQIVAWGALQIDENILLTALYIWQDNLKCTLFFIFSHVFSSSSPFFFFKSHFFFSDFSFKKP